jgi:NAD(P)-dependent dehydrogenase (short-subunit alcohol dehydrogenase family)
MPEFAAYAASKHAVMGLVRSAAREYAGRIRINAVNPATTDTPMVARFWERWPEWQVGAHACMGTEGSMSGRRAYVAVADARRDRCSGTGLSWGRGMHHTSLGEPQGFLDWLKGPSIAAKHALGLGPRQPSQLSATLSTDISAHVRAVTTMHGAQAAHSEYPMGRMATPEEVASAVVWLCTGATWTTGQALVIDGGARCC